MLGWAAGSLVGAAVVGIVGSEIVDRGIRNDPEVLHGFSEIQGGYQPVAITIPTQGDVVYVEKLSESALRKWNLPPYTTRALPNGDIEVVGPFFYQIRETPLARGPTRRWASSLPEREQMLLGPYADVRRGSVIFRRGS